MEQKRTNSGGKHDCIFTGGPYPCDNLMKRKDHAPEFLGPVSMKPDSRQHAY